MEIWRGSAATSYWAPAPEKREQFDLEKPPAGMLADGMMATAANLAELEERKIAFYSPIPIPELKANPAVRDDPTRPVPEEEWDQLPMRKLSTKGEKRQRQAHARKMATPEAKEKYARRRHPGERPFAVIKHHFGARRFPLRGLDRVRTEWNWLATAFNLQRLMSLIQSRAGPKPATFDV